MDWDLGPQGLALLGAMSLGFGTFVGLVTGKGVARRLVAGAITAVSCFGVGVVVSEVMFGWATEEDLQPNVDGLSRDEVLLSSVLTTVVIMLVLRYLERRAAGPKTRSGRHSIGPRHGLHRHA
ncbi:hypothetical protein [Nocardioides dilutus]